MAPAPGRWNVRTKHPSAIRVIPLSAREPARPVKPVVKTAERAPVRLDKGLTGMEAWDKGYEDASARRGKEKPVGEACQDWHDGYAAFLASADNF